jgi:hypothetical protein
LIFREECNVEVVLWDNGTPSNNRQLRKQETQYTPYLAMELLLHLFKKRPGDINLVHSLRTQEKILWCHECGIKLLRVTWWSKKIETCHFRTCMHNSALLFIYYK